MALWELPVRVARVLSFKLLLQSPGRQASDALLPHDYLPIIVKLQSQLP